MPFVPVGVQTGRSFANTDADRHGEFAFVGLPAGEAEVWARPQDSWEFVKAEVMLAPGDNAVELRFEKPDPVRLRGRITRSGKPQASSLFISVRGSMAMARTDADGRFEATLLHPGACKGWIWLGEGIPDPTAGELRSFELAIPDVDAHEIALDLDTLPRVSSFDEIDY